MFQVDVLPPPPLACCAAGTPSTTVSRSWSHFSCLGSHASRCPGPTNNLYRPPVQGRMRDKGRGREDGAVLARAAQGGGGGGIAKRGVAKTRA
jgi:hypothetical protein